MLSTTGTPKAGVYRDALQEVGFKLLEPNDSWQHHIHQAIYNKDYGIKSYSSPVTERATKDLIQAMNRLVKQGADALVLGCTEFPLAIVQRYYKGIPVIDPNRILARALIREWNPAKLKAIS